MKTNKIKILSLLGIISIIPSILTLQFFEKNSNISLNNYSSKNQEVNTNIIDIKTEDSSSGAIVDTTGDGKGDSVYMWGKNDYGQLGYEPEIGYYYDSTPTKIEGLPEGEIVDFSIGMNHVGVVIDTIGDGKGDSIYMWGSNARGELGHEPWTNGDNSATYPFNWNPTKVEGLPEGEIIDFSLGSYYSGVTLDVNDDGKIDSLYMWGDNGEGQLGHEPGTNGDNTSDHYRENINWVPTKVESLPEGEILSYLSRYDYTGVILDTNGDEKSNSLYMWGSNRYGELGHEPGTNGDIVDGSSFYNWNPLKVEGLPEGDLLEISLGSDHSKVLLDINNDSKTDEIYSWGYNNIGQLGHEPETNGDNYDYYNWHPTKIEGLPEGEIINVSSGGVHSGVMMDTNWDNSIDSIYMWGDNGHGQLGHEPGTNGDEFWGWLPYNWNPIMVENLPEGEILDISLGGRDSGITLDTNNDGKGDSLYMWGYNEYGQLGHEPGTNGDEYDSSLKSSSDNLYNWKPVKVEGIPTFSQDYYFESIDSIEVIDNESTIIINNSLRFFNNNTIDERKVKLIISDNKENIIEIETNLDIDTGQIIIDDSSHQFSNDESYYIESINYNSTVDNFDGYKYSYNPTSNNTFEVNWPSSNSLWWVWVLMTLILISIIFVIVIWIMINRKNKNEMIR